MKKIVIMVAIMALSIANFPTAVFGDELEVESLTEEIVDDETEPTDDEEQATDDESDDDASLGGDIYISEIYANPSDVKQKYIELYFDTDVVMGGGYYLMTATSENGTLSSNFYVQIANRKAGEYQLVLEEIISGLNLTNPAGTNRKFVWLCPIGETKESCRTETFIDKVEYGNHGALQSYSRDFDDPALPFEISLKTPGAANRFESSDDEDEDEGEEEPELDMCAYISLNEISFSDPEKFIEIINTTNQTIDLSDCALRRGNGYINLAGDLAAGEVKSFDVSNSDMTQTNGSVNIYIYDLLSRQNVTTVAYKAKAGASYAWLDVDGTEGWYSTFAMTPNAENIYQQFQTCEVGKHINVATGNCVKDPEPPAECAEGQYRNPATNRCKKLDSDKALAECADGQFRNPLTNRCKKIASDDELSPCAEGWERNPETNRCRKTPIGSEAAYAIDPVSNSSQDRAWLWIGGGGALVLGAMIAWQFHPEIARLFAKIVSKVKR
jgi:hypothetical protein